MALKFSSWFFDNKVAPELSKLKDPSIPDLSEYLKYGWLNALILRTTLKMTLSDQGRSNLVNFMRRTEASIEEYEAARAALNDYLAGPREVLTRYWRALNRFEYCISQAHQALFILRRMLKKNFFEKGDGSVEQRLSAVYNISHHLEKITEQGELDGQTGTVIWLTNDGLVTATDSLTFAEIAEVVEGLAKAAITLDDAMESRITSVIKTPSSREEDQPATEILVKVEPPADQTELTTRE
jgi:hypothetical protein